MSQHLLLSALNNGTATAELSKADVTALSVSVKGVCLPEVGSSVLAIPAHHPSEPSDPQCSARQLWNPPHFGGAIILKQGLGTGPMCPCHVPNPKAAENPHISKLSQLLFSPPLGPHPHDPRPHVLASSRQPL